MQCTPFYYNCKEIDGKLTEFNSVIMFTNFTQISKKKLVTHLNVERRFVIWTVKFLWPSSLIQRHWSAWTSRNRPVMAYRYTSELKFWSFQTASRPVNRLHSYYELDNCSTFFSRFENKLYCSSLFISFFDTKSFAIVSFTKCPSAKSIPLNKERRLVPTWLQHGPVSLVSNSIEC
jgi:hypothetical protein